MAYKRPEVSKLLSDHSKHSNSVLKHMDSFLGGKAKGKCTAEVAGPILTKATRSTRAQRRGRCALPAW